MGDAPFVLTLDASGLAEWESKLKTLLKNSAAAVGAAQYQEGLAIDARAVKDTPVEFGRLRSSHYVTPPVEIGPEIVVVEVGFGTEYAVPVHERTDVRHTSGKAKFLEGAMNARIPGYLERLVKRAQQNVRKGAGMVPLSAPTSPQDIGEAGAMQGPSKGSLKRGARKAAKVVRRQARSARRKARRAGRTATRQAKRAAAHTARVTSRKLGRERKSTAKKIKNVNRAAAKRQRKTQNRLKRQAKKAAKKLHRSRKSANPRDFDF